MFPDQYSTVSGYPSGVSQKKSDWPSTPSWPFSAVTDATTGFVARSEDTRKWNGRLNFAGAVAIHAFVEDGPHHQRDVSAGGRVHIGDRVDLLGARLWREQPLQHLGGDELHGARVSRQHGHDRLALLHAGGAGRGR